MSLARVLVLFVLLALGGLTSGAASAQTQVSYCVENTHTYNTGCFPTLAKAESFMRENTPTYKDVLKHVRTDTMSNGTVKLIYDVEDQPPQTFSDPVYLIGASESLTPWMCPGAVASEDHYFKNWCLSEQLLIDTYIASYLVDAGTCTYSNIVVTGGHVEPFNTISASWPDVWGKLGKSTTSLAGRRMLEWDVYCTGWGTGVPQHGYVVILKAQTIECPAKYRVRDPGGGPIRYPNLCEPTYWMPYITTRIKQCESCAKDGNPAVASTGNKEYRSTDFSWEGVDFSRAYNSTRDMPIDAGLGGNWSHGFSDSLMVTPPYGWVRSDGYVDYFAYVDSTHYKAQSHVGVVLLRGADPEVTGSAYRVLRGSSTRWFDANGRMLKLRSGGKDFTLQYCDAAGIAAETCIELNTLVAVKSDTGRTLSFVYESAQGDLRFRNDGTLSTVISQVLADGQPLMSYAYDTQGRLTDAIPAGQTAGTHYDYAEPSLLCRNSDGSAAAGCDAAEFPYHLTGVEDESGQRFATYSYDVSGRALTSEHAGGVGRVALGYVSDSSVSVALPSGATKTYGFVSGAYSTLPSSVSITAADGTTSSTSFGYSSDRITSKTVNGNRTNYTYDNYQRTSVTEGLTAAGAATAAKRVIQTDWDANLQLPTERRVYDAANALVGKQTYTYNSRGQVLTASSIDPVTSATRTTTTTYCEQADVTVGTCPVVGLVISVDGPRTDVNDVTTFTYYPSDHASCANAPAACPHRKGDLWMVLDAVGNVTETLAYDGAGRALSVKDANNVVTDFEYSARGWLTARKVRGSNNSSETDDQITRIDYFPTGLVQKTTLPDGSYTTYTYDAAHRLTDITDGEGNSIHYTLDNAGNRTQEQTKGSTGTVLRTLSRVYNQLGQLKTHQDAYSHATGYVYDANGNTDKVTDALNRVTDNDYDPLNRLAQSIQDLGGINATTQFQYDARDNLTAVIDPKGLTTGYSYNGLGDLTQLSSPDTGVTAYTYDSAGNRATQTDARGVTATYGYDALNRLTAVTYPDSSLNVGYTYDTATTACQTGETFAAGRLSLITDGSGSTQYCYDRFGQLVRKVQTTAGQSFTVRYGYTKAGQLSAVTYPDGTVADYVRDAQGRATEVGVTRPGQLREVLLTSASYYPFGPAAEWTFGNGRLFQRTLNQNYQPGIVQDQSAGGLSLGYEFDAVGNLVKLRNGDQSEPPLRRYVYDALNRLAETRDGSTDALLEDYGYDATGNRLSATDGGVTSSYTLDSTSHHLLSVAGVARSYDNAGNTTAIGGIAREFVFSDANRMSAVKKGGVTAMNYAYNGKGEQVRRSLGANGTATVYDEAGHWLGEYDDAGNPTQQVVWLDDLPVGLIVGTAAANQPLNYIEADALGTPRTVIESTRNVAVWNWALTGEAFGKDAPDEDVDGDSVSLAFGLRFPGQRYDAASGLNQNGFRDYEAATGRYPQSDPIGLSGGISTYGYVGGNPLGAIDPSGRNCVAANGQVTCTTPYGTLPPFSQPAGWPTTMNSNSWFHHTYDIKVPLNGANKDCVMNGIINNPTPGSPSPATPQGTVNNATPTGAQNLFDDVDYVSSFGKDSGGYNNSPVKSYVMNLNGSQVVVNVTLPGHPLFPGYVVRSIQGPNVSNYGEGNGWKQARWSPFASSINGVWDGQTKGITSNCGCQE